MLRYCDVIFDVLYNELYCFTSFVLHGSVMPLCQTYDVVLRSVVLPSSAMQYLVLCRVVCCLFLLFVFVFLFCFLKTFSFMLFCFAF